MKLLLWPPGHCLCCGGYTMNAIEPATVIGRTVSWFVHHYRCHDCRTCFMCVSNRRHQFGVRSLTAWVATLVFLVVIAVVAWAGMLLVRSIG